MKHCPKCKKDKDESEFRPRLKSKDGLQRYCLLCDKEYQHSWYERHKKIVKAKARLSSSKLRRRNQEFILDYLSTHHCVECGESDPIVLEFDHLRDKKQQISTMTLSCSLETLKSEIDKCQVLCCNCHRRKTSKQLNHYKSRTSSQMVRQSSAKA